MTGDTTPSYCCYALAPSALSKHRGFLRRILDVLYEDRQVVLR